MCAQRAREMYDRAAKERHASLSGRPAKDKPVENSSPVSGSGKSRDQVGEAFGVSGYSVDRAKKVIADGIPDLAEAVDQGKVTVSRAADIAGFPKGDQKQLLDLAVARGGKSPSPQETRGQGDRYPSASSLLFTSVSVTRSLARASSSLVVTASQRAWKRSPARERRYTMPLFEKWGLRVGQTNTAMKRIVPQIIPTIHSLVLSLM